MDSVGMFMLLFTLITLNFNLAESNDLELNDPTNADSTMLRPVFRRFKWRHLDGKPLTKHGRRRKSDTVRTVDDDSDDAEPRAVYWIPTTCDPFVERGYTCVGCGESLHCMGGGFALKAICMGIRPFCNNGICSNVRGEKCRKDGDDLAVQAAAVAPANATATVMPASGNSGPKVGGEDSLDVSKVPDVGMSDEAVVELEEFPDVDELPAEQQLPKDQHLPDAAKLPEAGELPIPEEVPLVAGARRI